jgi:ribosomal protein S18 acetylase RimI-like enzyme
MAVTFRYDALPADVAEVRELVAKTGVFHDHEVDVAVELVQERLNLGPPSEYEFIFAEEEGRLLGYTCFGPITITQGSFDLYWIAVRKDMQGRGLGKQLLAETMRLIEQAGGRKLYIETSARAEYAPTRAFYERSGCQLEATIADFYSVGDAKLIYVLDVPGRGAGASSH